MPKDVQGKPSPVDEYTALIDKFIGDGARYIYGTAQFSLWQYKELPYLVMCGKQERIRLINDNPTLFIFETGQVGNGPNLKQRWDMHVVEPTCLGMRYSIRFSKAEIWEEVLEKLRKLFEGHALLEFEVIRR